MRIKKSLFSLAFSLCMLFVCCVPAFATGPAESTASQETSEIQPRLNWNGPVYLVSGSWTTILGDNNVFAAYLSVHSDIDNPGTIEVRVLDEDRNQIVEPTLIFRGETIYLDVIPAFSGAYSLQAKAEVTGTYYFDIED